MRVLLLSTYELGRQPFGLASPAAWLRAAGADVVAIDVAKQRLDEGPIRWAELVAIYLPMHTATRLAVPLIRRLRALSPHTPLCCYGLYAPLNEPLLRSIGVDYVLGGEFEADLVELVKKCGMRNADLLRNEKLAIRNPQSKSLPRLKFRVPDRRDLPPLVQYASLQRPGGSRHVVGYTEASRGCKHVCRHCPVVPIYQGQFRIVPVDVVVADIRQQVEAGAEHITFGDPDFFNGIRHALAVAHAVAREHPGLTYDVTIKIEHLVQYARHLGTLRDTGCLFVTSAVESIDDRVLERLDKGHTRADVERAVVLCRRADLALAPTFVAFHPWLTLNGYCELLDAIADLDLVEQVAPVQLAIRLLVPAGSRLLDLPDLRSLVGTFDPESLAYPWRHPDPRVDALQEDVAQMVGTRLNAPRREIFSAVRALACQRAGRKLPASHSTDILGRTEVPYLNEPWYC